VSDIPNPVPLSVYEVIESPRGEIRRYAWGPGGLWVDVPGRHRPYYVCSAGVEHRRWWRLHQPGGTYPTVRRCPEHEVTETISPDFRRVIENEPLWTP
jgi:hypothetical protein